MCALSILPDSLLPVSGTPGGREVTGCARTGLALCWSTGRPRLASANGVAAGTAAAQLLGLDRSHPLIGLAWRTSGRCSDPEPQPRGKRRLRPSESLRSMGPCLTGRRKGVRKHTWTGDRPGGGSACCCRRRAHRSQTARACSCRSSSRRRAWEPPTAGPGDPVGVGHQEHHTPSLNCCRRYTGTQKNNLKP